MTCDRFESRLIAGEKPGDDPALAAHVGSCLRCFRTAADMREVPRLAALLREGEGEGQGDLAFDPGARFWEKFPGRVGAAWAGSRPATTWRMEPAAPFSWWARLSAWLRRPLPAALTGAACAVGLAFIVMRPAAGPESRSRSVTGSEDGAMTGVDRMRAEMASGYVLDGAIDDSMAELDMEGLVTLRDGLVQVMGPQDELAPSALDVDEAAATTASDPSKVADDLELLDETGLLALQQQLRERI
jgi:hypothetical protein